VDAILGSAKSMHTVISDECTGCELCVPACPVDCIDMVVHDQPIDTAEAGKFRTRFVARGNRIAIERVHNLSRKQSDSLNERKDYVQAALERARNKKLG
jgi:electron transport complex protein RnfB